MAFVKSYFFPLPFLAFVFCSIAITFSEVLHSSYSIAYLAENWAALTLSYLYILNNVYHLNKNIEDALLIHKVRTTLL